VGLLRRRWLQILLSGIVLLILVERTLIATSDPNCAPSVILLGAFLVPCGSGVLRSPAPCGAC
jgi:protease PrsW